MLEALTDAEFRILDLHTYLLYFAMEVWLCRQRFSGIGDLHLKMHAPKKGRQSFNKARIRP